MDYRKGAKKAKKRKFPWKKLTFENLSGIPLKRMISKAKNLKK